MNSRLEIRGACRHKPRFHRFIKRGADEGLKTPILTKRVSVCQPTNETNLMADTASTFASIESNYSTESLDSARLSLNEELLAEQTFLDV